MLDALPKAAIGHRALVSDFWAAYDSVTTTRHPCYLAHLLGKLKKLSLRHDTDEWNAFAKKTKRLFQDALRLRARTMPTGKRGAWRNAWKKYRDKLFTFLDHPEVPATNNHAEREIRFAVLIRKITYGNRSDRGARTQSILMSLPRSALSSRPAPYPLSSRQSL